MGRKITLFLILVAFALVVAPVQPIAQPQEDVFNQSGLPIPRFVSLRSNKVFVRTGPALRYPIKWIYVKEGLPIEIIQEFDTWRKIRDLEGEEGWIHQSLLSGKRKALVNTEKDAYLFRKPVNEAKHVAMLEPRVIVGLKECSGAWCSIEVSGFKGWIEKKSLWGVYEAEELD